MLYLRQNTSATLSVGVFVDKTDGFTPEAGLTAGGVDELGIWKHGATALTNIAPYTVMTFRSGGTYTITLTGTDTNTVGHLVLVVRDDAVCRPIVQEYMVLPQNVFDSLVAGSDLLDTNMDEISGDQLAAAMLEASAEGIIAGAAVSGTLSTTEMTTDLSETTDDHFVSGIIVWRTAALRYQKTQITSYDGTTKKLGFTAVTEAPNAGDKFVIL